MSLNIAFQYSLDNAAYFAVFFPFLQTCDYHIKRMFYFIAISFESKQYKYNITCTSKVGVALKFFTLKGSTHTKFTTSPTDSWNGVVTPEQIIIC
jgi:hypothetical protein